MDCKSCGRKNCTMANAAERLCQVCYNYTPDKSCKSMLEDFTSQASVPETKTPEPESSSSPKRQNISK